MLVDYVLESQNAGLFESVLFPLDIYNDSAQHALVTLKQRFLYDEIEAEVLSYNSIFEFRQQWFTSRNSFSYIMTIPMLQTYVLNEEKLYNRATVKRNKRKEM